MPNPKRRHSQTRRDKRRANYLRLTPPTLVKCQSCEGFHMPHHVCPSCGKYNERQVVSLRRGEAAEA